MAIEFYDSLNVDSNDDSYFLGKVGIGTTSPNGTGSTTRRNSPPNSKLGVVGNKNLILVISNL